MKPRRHGRCLALQILYECDVAAHSPLAVLGRLQSTPVLEDENYTVAATDFAQTLLKGIATENEQIDDYISRYAPEWPLDQIAVIDRNILRIAFYEILVANETPVKVAINEAVELAKMYGSDSTPRFVNGVLGTLVEKMGDAS